MKKSIELLAPGGDVDSVKAAIIAGADAIYCGLDKFNARNKAANIQFDELFGIIRVAHDYHCQVFVTLNILIVDAEIPSLFSLLNKLANTQIDGIIVQDIGLLYIVTNYFKTLPIHASTQMTTHNEGQILFLNKLNATRVNLSRELNIEEIKSLTICAHQNKMLTEVFVHGSNCICFSGLCYISSVQGGNSGNRGRCSQPCRDEYNKTAENKYFPLNLKDNSAYFDLEELAIAAVDSLKIEGRIKKFHYVYTVVDAWRKQLTRFYETNTISLDNSQLYHVFNRDFSNTFLKGDIHKSMFIDHPRDNSAIRHSENNGGLSDDNLDRAKGAIYDQRTEIISSVEEKIAQIDFGKIPIEIYVSGKLNTPLSITLITPEKTHVVNSKALLMDKGKQLLSYDVIFGRLKAIDESDYKIKSVDVSELDSILYLPFSELNSLKKRALFLLNDSRNPTIPVEIPILEKIHNEEQKTTLSVLISSPQQLYLANDSEIELYYQLPSDFSNGDISEWIDLFANNKTLTPWFPSVIIGDNYKNAVTLLSSINSRKIVTNNTGIAFEAHKRGIPWIAGPYMNIVNSFSLKCLKDDFHCMGAFISNEISKVQLKGIKKPEHFKLYYSIYHPIVLMTSRQCLFHQVIGCEKDQIDSTCVGSCKKMATITNLKKETLFIHKSKGNYHEIYHQFNYLNTDIVADFKNSFASLFVDLRDIETETMIKVPDTELISLFKSHLQGKSNSVEVLHEIILPTTRNQYIKGI